MKIKHFVITRFLTNGGLGLKDKIFDDNVILEGINYVNNYFIPTLNNQSNKNFEIIFLINDKHDEVNSNIKLLNDVNTHIKSHIVKYSNLNSFITEQSKEYDYLITSRIDYDDLIYNDAVDEIQKILIDTKPKYLLTYGYTNGTLLRDKKIYKYNPMYNFGYFSTFISLIVNLNNLAPINVGQLGDHTQIKKTLQKYCINNNIEYSNNMFIEAKNDKYYYVWVRHNNTASSLLNYNKEYQFNEEIQISDFKKIFGINI